MSSQSGNQQEKPSSCRLCWMQYTEAKIRDQEGALDGKHRCRKQLARIQVGAADAAGVDMHPHLACTRLPLWQFHGLQALRGERAGLEQSKCAHRSVCA